MSQDIPQKLHHSLPIRLLRLLRYNKSRSDRAVELLPPHKRPLYHGIPFLLHVNHPAFPGYIAQSDVPCGLHNYSLRDEVPGALRRLFPQNTALLENMAVLWPTDKAIDSLFLMGSIGSIGQSDDSDFDYWVCIDGNAFSQAQKSLLQQKCSLIEQWAAQYQLEVHFFLSEHEKVRQNDFGAADDESSGSAQAIFLKAEFYTTHILVAGKAPFWWLMPDKVTEQQYQHLLTQLKRGSNPDPKWFMDLGNIEKLDPNELFGAAIWQLSKAMDAPFKSLLKMAKLEVFLNNIEHQQPLCNILKKRVHDGSSAPGDLESVDPYALMFDELVAYYQQSQQPEVVNLLQTCLYIKCRCNLSASGNAHNFKQKIMASYVKQWGWDEHKIQNLDNIHYWDHQKLIRLSQDIHRFLLECYRRLSTRLQRNQQLVDAVDMTIIRRKLAVFYGRKKHKIDYLRSAFEKEIYASTLTIKHAADQTRWYLFHGNQVGAHTPPTQALKISRDPLILVVWGVWNRVIDNQSNLLLDTDELHLQEGDLKRCVYHLLRQMPPVRVSDLSRDALLGKEKIVACLALLNFNISPYYEGLERVNLIYLNSWGELFWGSDTAVLDKANTRGDGFRAYTLTPEAANAEKLHQAFSQTTKIPFISLADTAPD